MVHLDPAEAVARCMVCGRPTIVSLCSVTCRGAARAESARNTARIERLRSLGFDARLDEVQAVVRRNLELTRALDDPVVMSAEPAVH